MKGLEDAYDFVKKVAAGNGTVLSSAQRNRRRMLYTKRQRGQGLSL